MMMMMMMMSYFVKETQFWSANVPASLSRHAMTRLSRSTGCYLLVGVR